MDNIHSEAYVKNLFSEMSETYGIVNLLSSLGFAYFWRRKTVASIAGNAAVVGDLMTGGAECLSHIKKTFGPSTEVDLIDWCEKMCERARNTAERSNSDKCNIINCSALDVPVSDHRYDAIISTFGLKTLSEPEIASLAREMKRILKPGGKFSVLEFSIPQNRFIRFFFRLYVKVYVPFLGSIFLGNPDNYRMLWKYAEEFQNCKNASRAFEREGFCVEFKSHFFGSATQIVGTARE